jgi:catechol 2,3-dioxygenase-like lactoylglutathione lyase family enzyme
MISRMTHFTIHVLDLQRAIDFYTTKLGFTIVTDVPMPGGDRWITVCPPEQPDIEIILSPLARGRGVNAAAEIEQCKALVEKGFFGVGLFTAKDVYATYEELKVKGVHFKKPPTKEQYGVEAILTDDSGNWFSLVQLH